jgi:hypothetical protein
MIKWIRKMLGNTLVGTWAHAGHQHVTFESTAELAKAMHEAADAHHIFEQLHGKDENWPEWYANYMANPQEPTKPVSMAVPVDFSACHTETGSGLSRCMRSVQQHAAQVLTTVFSDTRVRY